MTFDLTGTDRVISAEPSQSHANFVEDLAGSVNASDPCASRSLTRENSVKRCWEFSMIFSVRMFWDCDASLLKVRLFATERIY